MKEFVDALVPLTKEWHDLVSQILQRAMKNPDDAGAASYDFLSYSGYVIYAYLFARMAAVAQPKAKSGAEADFYRAKVHTARFYFQRLLPRTRGLVPSMLSGSANLMNLEDRHFAF